MEKATAKGGSNSADGNTVNENTVSSTSPKTANDPIRTCGTCQSSVQGKSSKLLICLHTVCSPCYIAYTNGGEFDCAVCHTKSPATGIVENFVAHGLDANNKPIIKCSNELCTDGAVAKAYCVQCEEYLCSKCKDAHQRIKVTKDHQLTSVNDNRVTTLLSNVCQKHPQEELLLFCKKCHVLTCRDCQLSQEHSGHHAEHSNVQEATIEQRTLLTNFASQSFRKTSSLKGDYQLVINRLREVEEKRQKLKADLREAAKTLLQVIQNRIIELSQAVDRGCDESRRCLESVKTPLEQTIALGQQASSFTNAVLSLKDKHSLLHSVHYIQSQSEITNKRYRSCNLNVLQKPGQVVDLKLPVQEMIENISTFGTCTFGDSPSTSVANANNTNSSTASTSNGPAVASAQAQVLQGQSPSPLLQYQRHHRQEQQPRQDQQLPATVRSTQKPQSSPTVNPTTVRGLLNAPVEQSLQSPPAAVVSRTAYMAVNNRPPSAVSMTMQQMASLASGNPPPNTCVQQQTLPVRPRVPVQYVPVQQQPMAHQLSPQMQQQHPYFQQHGQFNVLMPGVQHGTFSGTNIHTSPPTMPQSPSGVSSTTVTPPVAYNGQYMYPNDQRPPMLNQCHPSQAFPPPPLHSAIQEFNQPYAVLQQHLHRPVIAPVSIFPDQANLRYYAPPPYTSPRQVAPVVQQGNGAVRVPTMPALVPAPTYSQQQQQQQRPLNSCCHQSPRERVTPVNESVPTMSRVILTSATSPEALRPEDSQCVIPMTALIRNRAASGDISGIQGTSSLDAAANVHSSAGSSSSAPPTPQQIIANGQATIEKETGSALDHRRAMEIADEFAQLAEMAREAQEPVEEVQVVQGSASAAAVSESIESRIQSVVTPPTPAPNVSSTTTDGENAQSGNGAVSGPVNGNRTDSSNSPPEGATPRRLARKTITYRLFPDPNGDATAEQGSCNGAPTASLSASEGDSGLSAINSAITVLKSDESSLKPKAAETGTVDSRSSDDQRVTTTDTQLKEQDDFEDIYSKPLDSVRSWDDWCNVCQNGGCLVCCDGPGCPRVFHMEHHVPQLYAVPTGKWVCTFCIDLESYKTPLDDQPRDDRKILTEYELKVCQRILLELCVLPEGTAFHEPVDAIWEDYFAVIKEPMDFSTIRKRLDRSNPQCYRHVLEFIKDLNQVFVNCDIYNTEETNRQVRAAGIAVGQEYVGLVQKYFPDLVGHVRLTKSSPKRPLSATSSSEGESSVYASSRRRRVVLHDDDDD